ncbi:MAG: outer membrane protein assembly factor BamB family protein, partial [Actinomycetota bacterium]
EGLLISPWEEPFAADNLITTAPVLAGDLLYVGSQSGTVYAIDAESGQAVWQFSAGAAIRDEVVVLPGVVVVTTAAGEVIAIAGE